MAAAVVQGAVVVSLTVFLVLGQISFIKLEVSRVMAAGGAGTWFTFGYVMYILVGVVGVVDGGASGGARCHGSPRSADGADPKPTRDTPWTGAGHAARLKDVAGLA